MEALLKADPQQQTTEQKILQAAIACIMTLGLDKTNVQDVAKTAGISRKTIYQYFPRRDDLIIAAMRTYALIFAEQLIDHIKRYRSARKRLITALVYSIDRLSREPYMNLILEPQLATIVMSEMFASKFSLNLHDQLMSAVIGDAIISDKRRAEITEMAARTVMSFLMMRSPQPRDEKSLSSMLEKWIDKDLIG